MGMLAQAECRAFLGHRHGDEPSNVFQATSRRDAGLKMLCIMSTAHGFPKMGFWEKSMSEV
jgi:hypothetical protein